MNSSTHPLHLNQINTAKCIDPRRKWWKPWSMRAHTMQLLTQMMWTSKGVRPSEKPIVEKGDDCKGGNTFFFFWEARIMGGFRVWWRCYFWWSFSRNVGEEVQTYFKDPNDSTLRSVWSLEVFGQMWPFAKFPMAIVSCEALPANFQPGCPALVGK